MNDKNPDSNLGNPPAAPGNIHAADAERAGDSIEAKSPRNIHGWKWAAAYGSMLSTTFLFALDNTIVADIQPSILQSFPNAAPLLPWAGTGFALGTMAILPWGRAYGVFNTRHLYWLNILLFAAGSALCGAAPDMQAFIVGRVLAGIGGAGMYSGTLTYVSALTGMGERPAYLAGSTVVWGIGSVLGPVVGGAFADSSATWRWGFYINLVVEAVSAPAYILLCPSVDPQPGKILRERCAMVDWATTATFVGGSACFITAISFGGVLYAWESATMIGLWIASAVLLVVTVLLLRFHPFITRPNVLYPVHFLKQPMLMNMQLQVFLSSGIIFGMTYYIPLFFQFIRGDSPLEAGIRLLPLIVTMVVVSMVNGLLLPRWSLVSPWYIVGSGLVLAGTALMYTVDYTTPNANIYGYSILVGTGAGCYIVAGFSVTQALVPVTDVANAIAAMTISQDLGMVIFLAISGNVYQNVALRNIASVQPNLSTIQLSDLVAGSSSRTFTGLSEGAKAAVLVEIEKAMSNIWLFYLIAGALSFVGSLSIGKLRLPMHK